LSFFVLDPIKGRGREIGRLRTTFPVWALSPDGSRIALIGDGIGGHTAKNGILAMNVGNGEVGDLHVEGLAFPFDLAWSSDGRSLFFTDIVANAESPGWRVVHADSDGRVHVLWQSRIVWGQFSNPLPSPDGRYLAFEQLSFESNAWTLENF
jgi:Tol biopolymer transport system component